MSGQCVITLFRFTLLQASGSNGPYPPVSTPGSFARQNFSRVPRMCRESRVSFPRDAE